MRERQHPTPGELSAIVAEKLMGWTEVEFGPLPGRVSQVKKWHGKHPHSLSGDLHDRLSMYAAEMGPAWEVVEEMVDERGYGFHLDRVGQEWEATFTKDGDRQYGDSWKCQSVTAPGAICRAALLAVEG